MTVDLLLPLRARPPVAPRLLVARKGLRVHMPDGDVVEVLRTRLDRVTARWAGSGAEATMIAGCWRFLVAGGEEGR